MDLAYVNPSKSSTLFNPRSLAALKTSAIDLLSDPDEDIYTLEDCKLIDHET